jgi:hypothetical protein
MKRVLILSLLTLSITTLAHAQATRTWVSGVGDDANPCSRTAPCKTFAGAISKTALGGIINCLDPGGFGAVTITKSITIDCTGTMGSVLSSGVQGVIVNGLTNSQVVLRAIDINGAGTTLGTNGVNVIQAGSVSLYDVNIANYSTTGLTATNGSNLISIYLDSCQILNSAKGINMANTGTGIAKLRVESSAIEHNSNIGVHITGVNGAAFISHSNISANTNANFQVDQSSSVCFLEGDFLTASATGIIAGTGVNTPVIRLSRTTVTGNTTNGISGSGQTICFSNNVIAGNVGNNNCSSPLNAQQ